MPTACDRCGRSALVTSMSFFNTDVICDECRELERKHPDFQRAHDIEEEHVRAGDFNFPGVGAPPDLIAASRALGRAS